MEKLVVHGGFTLRRTLVQYDYRHTDGELFACVKPSLDECRAARDKWLNAKQGKEGNR